MDIEKLIAAGLFSSLAAHPYGHIAEASKEGRPASVDYRTGTESYNDEGLSPEKKANIHGAGFEMQDRMANAMDSPEMHGFNAVYKTLFPYIVDKMGSAIPGGDIGGMERSSGNKYIKPILGASAFYDAYKAMHPDNNVNVGFSTFGKGTPGLMATVPIDQNLIPVWSKSSKRK